MTRIITQNFPQRLQRGPEGKLVPGGEAKVRRELALDGDAVFFDLSFNTTAISRFE